MASCDMECVWRHSTFEGKEIMVNCEAFVGLRQPLTSVAAAEPALVSAGHDAQRLPVSVSAALLLSTS